jgi:hypothetical protein
VHWPSVAEFHLIFGHVNQPLVKCRAHENQGLHPFTSSAIYNALGSPF